jgi:hypothetical protein
LAEAVPSGGRRECQNAQKHDKVRTVARLNPLHRALRDAGFLGQLGLRQSRIDSATLQTVADFMQNRHIG